MKYDHAKSIQILSRTPQVLESLLSGLDKEWIMNNEGGETWSPYDIVGHLIHGERTDWIARLNKILVDEDKKFQPFDRFAQFNESIGKSMSDLLSEFDSLRKKNLDILRSHDFGDDDYRKQGIHPVFGIVTLKQLLSTWVVHDLNHIGQVVRVMAKQYGEETGPWKEYLPILHPRVKS
jgi:hypothetical protein